GARRPAVVRFGQFASTSTNKDRALDFGKDTFFSVETCYGVPIEDFSSFPGEEEVLIPPFETFEVTNITSSRDGVFIELRSTGTHSNYSCEFVK
ncbi:PREDICTED: erythroblast NAD(P)(+)--arginine ADP-ribosyltransferase-like, partial [Tauraco erythrolophus]|uniref:erythroblast NAD(P)(+)--arginine ADP-ribosyltransferase-like n=1 Tax=Tauraco erythrolophus TaxID=121530 RepID=UPI00052345A1